MSGEAVSEVFRMTPERARYALRLAESVYAKREPSEFIREWMEALRLRAGNLAEPKRSEPEAKA